MSPILPSVLFYFLLFAGAKTIERIETIEKPGIRRASPALIQARQKFSDGERGRQGGVDRKRSSSPGQRIPRTSYRFWDASSCSISYITVRSCPRAPGQARTRSCPQDFVDVRPEAIFSGHATVTTRTTPLLSPSGPARQSMRRRRLATDAAGRDQDVQRSNLAQRRGQAIPDGAPVELRRGRAETHRQESTRAPWPILRAARRRSEDHPVRPADLHHSPSSMSISGTAPVDTSFPHTPAQQSRRSAATRDASSTLHRPAITFPACSPLARRSQPAEQPRAQGAGQLTRQPPGRRERRHHRDLLSVRGAQGETTSPSPRQFGGSREGRHSTGYTQHKHKQNLKRAQIITIERAEGHITPA